MRVSFDQNGSRVKPAKVRTVKRGSVLAKFCKPVLSKPNIDPREGLRVAEGSREFTVRP